MKASEPNWHQLFEELAQHPLQIALVCTGGGSGAIAKCFRRSGASRNFVDAAIPYSRAAAVDYAGQTSDGSHASADFSMLLAHAAYNRAAEFGGNGAKFAIGIALTAVMPTAPANDVEQRIHVAVYRQHDQQCWSEILETGSHTRESAEDIADSMMYRAIEYAISTTTG